MITFIRSLGKNMLYAGVGLILTPVAPYVGLPMLVGSVSSGVQAIVRGAREIADEKDGDVYFVYYDLDSVGLLIVKLGFQLVLILMSHLKQQQIRIQEQLKLNERQFKDLVKARIVKQKNCNQQNQNKVGALDLKIEKLTGQNINIDEIKVFWRLRHMQKDSLETITMIGGKTIVKHLPGNWFNIRQVDQK
ncbi:UNKNOWN [Stylonychia lemnae]|uniref:Uncharacterized protein n=1 Tax=Stylonychia lemnae TaxID=5949 RepID=A0A077ZYC1_STYLE|nr:UNKNOWN [Stylonychia lemnae]|eukprot:CDW74916.1 UNKNOWN [Stylonychia lemnae]